MQQRGFSLVEILVGTAILSTALIAILAAFPQSYRQITKAGRISTLTHLAQEQIDELRASGFSSSDLTAGVHPSAPTLVSGYYYYPVSGFNNYSLRWTVTDFASVSGGSNDMKTVIIEVGHNVAYNDTGTQLLDETEGTILVRFQTYFTN